MNYRTIKNMVIASKVQCSFGPLWPLQKEHLLALCILCVTYGVQYSCWCLVIRYFNTIFIYVCRYMFGSLFYNVGRTHLRILLNYEKINIVSSCGIIQKSHKMLAEASAFVCFHMILPGSLFYPTSCSVSQFIPFFSIITY